jgi:Flp pilus assembly protein TadG
MGYSAMQNPRMYGLKSKGQALIEMAIVIPLLLLLVLGIFEFGRAMYIKNTLTHAARSGARTAAVTPNLAPDTTYTGCSSTNAVVQTACQNLYSGINKNNVSILVQAFSPGSTTPKGSSAISGDSVKVTVTVSGFTSVVPKIVPVPTTLSGDTAMRYE